MRWAQAVTSGSTMQDMEEARFPVLKTFFGACCLRGFELKYLQNHTVGTGQKHNAGRSEVGSKKVTGYGPELGVVGLKAGGSEDDPKAEYVCAAPGDQ
jgi:hypothetical protein